ncbi:hypothetical protein ACFPRL_22500 [Pseudoclavibacter helvolus]
MWRNAVSARAKRDPPQLSAGGARRPRASPPEGLAEGQRRTSAPTGLWENAVRASPGCTTPQHWPRSARRQRRRIGSGA